MIQMRAWLSSASAILHEAALIGKKGMPEDTAIAMRLLDEAVEMVDLCIAKKIPVIPPECTECPHHDTQPHTKLRMDAKQG